MYSIKFTNGNEQEIKNELIKKIKKIKPINIISFLFCPFYCIYILYMIVKNIELKNKMIHKNLFTFCYFCIFYDACFNINDNKYENYEIL